MRGWISLVIGLAVGCTTLRDYDPARPAEAWDISCYERDIAGMPSWVILDCTMQNLAREALPMPVIAKVAANNAAWRQAEPQELQQLERDVKARGRPLVLAGLPGAQGPASVEGMVAHLVVLSGVVVLSQTPTSPAAKDKILTTAIKPRDSVNQSFVLYRESLDAPQSVRLDDSSARFSKRVDLPSNQRRRSGS